MEITEEVGLRSSELFTLQLLGMVQRERDKRPVLVGHTRTTLSKSEMEARFCCQRIHTEACRILFCDIRQVETFFQENEQIMPEHRGALQLYFESSVCQQDWKLCKE
ncbi:Nudix hydrolase 9 [Galdieria sulphuraria]|nr:Nudix hydrolase 9 [Galdieria sulphuraria]